MKNVEPLIALELPAEPHSAKVARDAIAGLDGHLGTVFRDVVLLISELVTNSVRHADTADGTPITVTAGTSDGAVWFAVADAGEPGSVSRRPPEGKGGMGLNIVHTAASRWGTSDGDGTHVWFELALPTG
jgi:anti-sigma regulatory factor (Ser/Thr protein kinase)